MSIVHLDTGKDKATEDGAASDAQEAALTEALRLRAAEALEKAYEFLSLRPDPWVRLRAKVLCEACPASDLESRLIDVQQEEGGFPLLAVASGGGAGFPDLASLVIDPRAERMIGTLEALLIAADARILNRDWTETAIRQLEATQDSDGAFRIGTPAGEGASTSEPTAGNDPTIFWTGMIGGILGRSPRSRPAVLEAAGEYLAQRFSPDSVEHDGYPELLAYAHFFTNVAHDLSDEALQWCGRALEKGFRSRHLDAVSTVRVLLTCDAQAMPGANFDVVELLERLLEEQAGDGGFAELSLGGPEARTTQTFDAMLAIVRLCAALDA